MKEKPAARPCAASPFAEHPCSKTGRLPRFDCGRSQSFAAAALICILSVTGTTRLESKERTRPMPFASHNEIVAAGGHSVPTILKMRLALQETSGSVAHNSAISVDEPIVGYTPTADVGPNAVLPNALVAGAAPNTVNLASMVSLGNRTLLGWAYLPAIEGTEACWIINGQYSNGRAGISSTRQLIAKRGGTITAVTSIVPLGEWVQLSFRHNGTRWRFGINGVYEDVVGEWSDSTNLLGLATNDLNGKAARFAHWSAYSDEITDAEERLYFRGPEPIRSAHPVLSQGDSTWSATPGTYGLPSPLAADANGEFTYEWELRLSADDSVVQSGTGTPGGAKPAAGTYYVWVRPSNNAGYDSLQDGESADVALTAPEIESAGINPDGDRLTVTGSDTLANYAGFSMAGYTLTPVSGTGTLSLVYSVSPTVDKDADLYLDFAAGDVTIGGSPLNEFTGYLVDNGSTQDIAAPLITGVTFASGNLTVVSNEVMSGYDGFVLTSDLGVAIPLTYVNGDDSNTRVFAAGREVGGWEVLNLAYTAGDVVDEGANALADFSEFAVTNNSSVTEMWLPSVLDISGELLLMEFVNSSGTVPLNIGDGATGNLSVDFGGGAFHVSPEHVGLIRNSNRIAVIIPETERLSSIPSCTISASAGWIKRSGGADIAAVSQTLWASNILAEPIPYVTPRKLEKFGVNFGRAGYYQNNWFWSNLVRCFDGVWQYQSDANIKAATTNLGLPNESVATEIWGFLNGGTLPFDSIYIMWEGDTSLEFSVSDGPTTEDSDTTSGSKRWKKYSWPGAKTDRLKISCPGDCSSITNFVVCRDTDWDDTAKDIASVGMPEVLERYAGVTYLRFLEHQDINRFSSPAAAHITHADYQVAKGQVLTESAAISNIEDYTTNTDYYVTDGDYFGLGGSYGGDGSSVIKVTHDGSVTFYTGDPVRLEDVVGTIDGYDFTNYRVANEAVYVPDGVTTYFYLYASGLDAQNMTYTSGGNAVIERRMGAPPEMLAEVCNFLHDNCSLTHIWLMAGVHESPARQAAYAARLNAALSPTIKIYCEWSNEWTFNWAVPFSFAYTYARRIHNVSGVSGMDDEWDAGAYYLSQFYDTLVAEFGESRVEPVVVGQTFTSQAYTGMLDSALLTAPVTKISANNYFLINRADMQLGAEEADSISPSGMCTLASETINALQFGAWGSLSDFAQGRSLEVLNYEGGNHSTGYLDHPIEYTTGWAIASGNRYTRSEFRHITSVKNGSTTLAKAVDATACGTTDNSFFWDSSGEVLHVNLAGTDPDTVTLTAMRYDRFSMAERYHVNHPRFARVFNRMFDILDTLGISANQYNMAGRQANDGSLEAFVWGAYGYYDQVAGDGIGEPDNAALTEQVYRGDIDKSVYYPQIESIRGYEINRWTDPANFLPTAESVTVDANATTVTFVASKPVEAGADGWGGLVVGGVACTYASGSGTDTIVFTAASAIAPGTITAAYTQPGNGIKDLDGGLLASFIGMAVTNNVPVIVSPTVTTATPSSLRSDGATVGGNVTDDGGATVTSRGVYWSTSPNPTASDNVVTADAGGEGAFTVEITGAPAETVIYVKAWATSSVDTSTGSEVNFETLAVTEIVIYNNPSIVKV